MSSIREARKSEYSTLDNVTKLYSSQNGTNSGRSQEITNVPEWIDKAVLPGSDENGSAPICVDEYGVRFGGSGDHQDPRNFGKTRKWMIVIVLSLSSASISTFGAIFPLFGIQMYERLGFDWATAVLAFITLAMVPFPFIFFRYGKSIRGNRRFASTF